MRPTTWLTSLLFALQLACVAPALAGDGDIAYSNKNYSVTESHNPDGAVRYVWLTKDNRTGSASSVADAKKAAKAALKEESSGDDKKK
jgi:hypothetical protein